MESVRYQNVNAVEIWKQEEENLSILVSQFSIKSLKHFWTEISSLDHNDKFHDAMTFGKLFPEEYKKMDEQWEKFLT